MESSTDCNTSDSSNPRKCLEIMMKPTVTKLKNIPTPFCSFLTMLISHESMMDWTDTCALVINRFSTSILEKNTMVPLEKKSARVTATNSTSTMVPDLTRKVAGGTSVSAAPTRHQIENSKAKSLHAFF